MPTHRPVSQHEHQLSANETLLSITDTSGQGVFGLVTRSLPSQLAMTAPSSQYRVLVVDDLAQNIRLMRGMLERADYLVLAAMDGAAALRMAQESAPDLILLDVMMPELDGYTVCGRLKESEATRHIPVIFVTALNDVQAEINCFAAGAADFICKPVTMPVLLARVKAHLALHEQRLDLLGMFRDVVESAPDALVISDLQGRIVRINALAEQLTGYARAELIGQPIEVLLPERSRAVHPALRDGFAAATGSRHMRSGRSVQARRKDGSLCEVEVSLSGIQTTQGPLVVSALRDITARRQPEAELRIAAAAFESQEGMVVTDVNNVILRVNRAFTEITGYSSEDAVGQTPRLLRSGLHDAAFYRDMWEAIERTGGWRGEIWDKRKNGEIYPKWLTISAVKGEDGVVTHYIGAQYDITERKKAEAKIAELAFFDQLTCLPNRTLMLDRLKQATTTSGRSGKYAALLIIDLDHFKTLNDTLGHDVGDSLLKQVGKRLSQCVRDGDTVARLGGDEFVVILTSLSTSRVDAGSNTTTVANKILAALCESYQLDHTAHHGTASIGVTLFRGQDASADDLMKQADLAMYRSKAAGRNTVRFFDPEMETAVLRRVSLEKDLEAAIATRQFLLHYQAQVARDGRVTGAEVLVRWQHPQRGLVSPSEFIPLAEETGLILPLGHWVLETACAQLALWATQPALSHLSVAVNVSAHQFRQPGFVEQVLSVLRRCGADPRRLKLELTESLLLDNLGEIVQKMSALKATGVGFALDDFGTGYSSLSYLKRLPLDQLKIDQSFVRDVLHDPNDAAIAQTIVALAGSLGLDVIAEGVETVAQRDFLAANGCHAYQGYLFSRPLPLEGFEQLAQRVGPAMLPEQALDVSDLAG